MPRPRFRDPLKIETPSEGSVDPVSGNHRDGPLITELVTGWFSQRPVTEVSGSGEISDVQSTVLSTGTVLVPSSTTFTAASIVTHLRTNSRWRVHGQPAERRDGRDRGAFLAAQVQRISDLP